MCDIGVMWGVGVPPLIPASTRPRHMKHSTVNQLLDTPACTHAIVQLYLWWLGGSVALWGAAGGGQDAGAHMMPHVYQYMVCACHHACVCAAAPPNCNLFLYFLPYCCASSTRSRCKYTVVYNLYFYLACFAHLTYSLGRHCALA